MMKRKYMTAFLMALWLLGLCACENSGEDGRSMEITLLSNNIKINNSQESAEALAAAYGTVNADILTLQEVDDNWHDALNLDGILADLGYAMIPVPADFQQDIYGTETDQSNRNPIYYKADRFRLVQSGKKLYDAFSFPGATKKGVPLYGYRSYSYTWALLADQETGKQFVVISTHLNASVQHDTATEEQKALATQYRSDSAKELAAAMADMESKFSCPVIVAGDFNSRSKTEAYGIMAANFLSAREHAAVTANLEYSTTNKQGSMPDVGFAIDHCFYSKEGVAANRFETLLKAGEVDTYSYSDHVPIFFCFTLT